MGQGQKPQNARPRAIEILNPVRQGEALDGIWRHRFPMGHQPVVLADVPTKVPLVMRVGMTGKEPVHKIARHLVIVPVTAGGPSVQFPQIGIRKSIQAGIAQPDNLWQPLSAQPPRHL
jgi:hypothetical protein